MIVCARKGQVEKNAHRNENDTWNSEKNSYGK